MSTTINVAGFYTSNALDACAGACARARVLLAAAGAPPGTACASCTKTAPPVAAPHSGHSGSGVIDVASNSNYVVALVSGETYVMSNGACVNNLFAPNVLAANAASNCERASGGASLLCLMNQLPA